MGEMDEIASENNKLLLSNMNLQQKAKVIEKRIKDLDDNIKNVLSKNKTSVRRTFLKLDSNNKGYITVQDIFAAVCTHFKIDYNDLKKLVKEKDT